MLNFIWPIFLIVSFLYSIIFGNIGDVNESIFESTEKAVSLSIQLLGTICLWNGIMKIAMETEIVKILTKLLEPIFKRLFPDVSKNENVHKEISMNVVANILGLGNAATPLGLKAMKSLQKKNNNKKVLSDSMAMFIVINTASIQIIPTTVIAIRSSLNSSNPTAMIVQIWIATICAAFAAIFSAKILMKKW